MRIYDYHNRCSIVHDSTRQCVHDDNLYYTGRLVVIGDDEPDYDDLIGPLTDFGTPNAGAVTIRYKGHPEWDI